MACGFADLPSAVRRPEIDRLKGVLIALVVLGHNGLFSESAPGAFNILYNFHVASFLLIPFLYERVGFSRGRLGDRFTRYMVPHFIFFGLACAAYFLLFVPKLPIEMLGWLKSVGLAVVFSSEAKYNEASGFRLFWFLPALWTLVVIMTAYYGAGVRGKMMILSVALCVHLLLGLLPEHLLPYLPWGLPLVLFIFPVGLLAGEMWNRFKDTSIWLWICGIVFVVCIYLSWTLNSSIALAGDPRVYSILEPGLFIFHDIFLLCAFFALLGIAAVVPDAVFRKLGLASLFIYLSHGFVWQILLRIGLVDWIHGAVGVNAASVLVTYAITLGVCLASYELVRSREALWSFIFPRSKAEWRFPAWRGLRPSGR